MLTLAGAGVSLVVTLLLLGAPVLRDCLPDDRGLLACLREATVERLDLPVAIAGLPEQATPLAVEPGPGVETDLAEVPGPSLVPDVDAPLVAAPPVTSEPRSDVADPVDIAATPDAIVADPPPLPVPRPVAAAPAVELPLELEAETAVEKESLLAPEPSATADVPVPQPHRPSAGKLERPSVTGEATNVVPPPVQEVEMPRPLPEVPVADAPPVIAPAGAGDGVPPPANPAETGSIEMPAAPSLEDLTVPELAELPQLPPPPLPKPVEEEAAASESGPANAPVVERSATGLPEADLPEGATETVAEVGEEEATVAAAVTVAAPPLAAQPLPASALPPPLPVESAGGAESAAAAAVALADPALSPTVEPVPASPAPSVAAPSVLSPGHAEISPLPPDPTPQIVVVPHSDPTIDTIAFEEEGTVVAGDGPEGALIRLYVDAELAGEGEVQDGRWQVFGAPVFAQPLQVLRVEALDRDTGRMLGESEISLEIELPESSVPPPVDAPQPSRVPERIANADPASTKTAPAPVPPAPPAVAPAPREEPATDLAAGQTEPAPSPRELPPLRTVVPLGETQSVTILPSNGANSVEVPGTGFTVIGN